MFESLLKLAEAELQLLIKFALGRIPAGTLRGCTVAENWRARQDSNLRPQA